MAELELDDKTIAYKLDELRNELEAKIDTERLDLSDGDDPVYVLDQAIEAIAAENSADGGGAFIVMAHPRDSTSFPVAVYGDEPEAEEHAPAIRDNRDMGAGVVSKPVENEFTADILTSEVAE